MNSPRALGIHIYAGGFTLGMRKWLDVQAHIERYKLGADTVRRNLELPVNMAYGTPRDFAKTAGDWAKGRAIEVVYGNPPCVAFSRLGTGLGVAHPTIADWYDWLYTVEAVQPKIAVLECVQQAWSKGQELVLTFAKKLQDMGYRPTIFLSDAYLHGASQLRARFHLVASKVQLDFPTPKTSAFGGTVREMLTWLEGTDQKLIPQYDLTRLLPPAYYRWIGKYVQPGQNCRKVWMHLMGKAETSLGPNKGCPPFIAQRLGWDRPAPTFAGGPDFFHPGVWRSITPTEMAVLSGYPSNYRFHANTGEAYKEVARAVMPVMGNYLGEVFAMGIKEDRGEPTLEIREINFTPMARQHLGLSLKPPKMVPELFGSCKAGVPA